MMLIHSLKSEIQLHWSSIILEDKLKAKRLFVYHLPFPFFLSRVFEHFGVDVEGGTFIVMQPSNKIGETTLQNIGLMKRNE